MIDGQLDSAISHELLITGYDDDVQVRDDNGHTQQGIFTLRNSWSSLVGDNGNYYVTYDYFKFLALEAMALQIKK